MIYERLSEVLQKMVKMEHMSFDDDVMWLAAQMAYRRNTLKHRVIAASRVSDSEHWQAKDWPKTTHLAVAIILNRQDVLARLGYTILEAVERIGPPMMTMLVSLEAELRSEGHFEGVAHR